MSVNGVQDFLFEVGCEELPTAALQPLSQSLVESLELQLRQAKLAYTRIESFATPRRLAILIHELSNKQADCLIEQLGPAAHQAYDNEGKPLPAVIGFARSCGIPLEQLQLRETEKGLRVVGIINQTGASVAELLPKFLQEAINKLPIAKPMRWGSHPFSFVRPVHWLVLLYGEQCVPANILGRSSEPYTYGHRFHHPDKINIPFPKDYASTLREVGFVVASFAARRQRINELIAECLQTDEQAVISDALLDEVTALVEWPVALSGHFKAEFLSIPQEVLITSMQTHQKCFAVVNAEQQLQAKFIVISNINSKHPPAVIGGNERVINARLADAAFFYIQDCKQGLRDLAPKLHHVVFQQQLGSLAQKTQRVVYLAETIAHQIGADVAITAEATALAKCDLLSSMVGEFPSLQGTMGYYYALHEGCSAAVATAIQQHYWPRFAGDKLPDTLEAVAVAVADRIDTLVGILGINQTPTGDKDPFALRRAALGICRLIIEKSLPIDLIELLTQAYQAYHNTINLPNHAVVTEAFSFILQRLKSWYLDQDVTMDVFAAVAACQPTSLLDFNLRVRAVEEFKNLPEASTLAAANKRVSNILKKQSAQLPLAIDKSLLLLPAEQHLYHLLEQLGKQVAGLCQQAKYHQALLLLVTLKPAIDDFFDQVMVMVEDETVRLNRLVLLSALRQLFTQIADIALLHSAAVST